MRAEAEQDQEALSSVPFLAMAALVVATWKKREFIAGSARQRRTETKNIYDPNTLLYWPARRFLLSHLFYLSMNPTTNTMYRVHASSSCRPVSPCFAPVPSVKRTSRTSCSRTSWMPAVAPSASGPSVTPSPTAETVPSLATTTSSS